jgi:hypothetical protein
MGAVKLRQKDSLLPAREEGDDKKHKVRWVQPTQGMKDNSRNQREAITKYSQALYNQTWDEIWTSERPFKFPSIRTLVYSRKVGKDLIEESHPQTSTSFRRVFNLIKRDTEG